MKILLPIVFFSSIILLSSCYNDKEELLYGINLPCTDSTGVVSYSLKIVPMFQSNCYTCHTGSFPSGSIVMGTYAADKAIAQSGKLYGSVNHIGGYSPMPKGMPKMNNCQVAIIKKWIDAGMPNN